jgi:hypothetical protein
MTFWLLVILVLTSVAVFVFIAQRGDPDGNAPRAMGCIPSVCMSSRSRTINSW